MDKDTRSEIYNQVSTIKDQVGEDPKALIPIFAEVVVSVENPIELSHLSQLARWVSFEWIFQIELTSRIKEHL